MYEIWSAQVKSDGVKGNPENGWKAYYNLYDVIRLVNREYLLPKDWNFPPDETQRLFGDRLANMEDPPDTGTDSAVEYSAESESDETDFDEPGGLDGLEYRMRKEYNSLSSGKVLYWWPVGTGTQTFVRYGLKRNLIFRVRAGSSQPYDPRVAERVLNITPGNRKRLIETDGMTEEVWENSRNDVLDIISVGWKVEDDDEASENALASIRPRRDAVYPHTRALVKWKKGQTSLERRGFIRRITSGNSFNGDRVIYLKAKEMENAYWGYDVEEENDNESDDSDSRSSDRSQKRRAHSSRSGKSSSRHRRGVHFVESEREGSDADSMSSQSSLDPPQSSRQPRRHISSGKPQSSRKGVDAKVRLLTEELNRLKVELGRGSHDQTRLRRNRRRRSHN